MSLIAWKQLWQRRTIGLTFILFVLALLVRHSRSKSAWFSSSLGDAFLGTASGPISPRDNAMVMQQGNVTLESYTAPFECNTRNLPKTVRMVNMMPEDYTLLVHGVQDIVSDFLYNRGAWEPDEAQIMKRWAEAIRQVDPTRNTYVDLGTNIAAHAMQFVKWGFNVHMFEPTFANHVLVQCSLAMTGVVGPKVRLNTFGLGDSPMEVCMHIADANFGGTSVAPANRNCLPRLKSTIGTMDHYWKKLMAGSGDKVGVFKMDIEGFETDALKGALDYFASDEAPVVVYFEFMPKNHKAHGKNPMVMIKYFIDRGYQIYAQDLTKQWHFEDFEKFGVAEEAFSNCLAVKSDFYMEMLQMGYDFDGAQILREPVQAL